ncbi:hypothetical protein RRG08_022234 [Elysia crispata]|nr:hypothetical protein RRG08_022234 [Elysia crispata]
MVGNIFTWESWAGSRNLSWRPVGQAPPFDYILIPLRHDELFAILLYSICLRPGFSSSILLSATSPAPGAPTCPNIGAPGARVRCGPGNSPRPTPRTLL